MKKIYKYLYEYYFIAKTVKKIMKKKPGKVTQETVKIKLDGKTYNLPKYIKE